LLDRQINVTLRGVALARVSARRRRQMWCRFVLSSDGHQILLCSGCCPSFIRVQLTLTAIKQSLGCPAPKSGVALDEVRNRTVGPGLRTNPLTAPVRPELALSPRAGIEAKSLPKTDVPGRQSADSRIHQRARMGAIGRKYAARLQSPLTDLLLPYD
jgi:hypothetical protein